MHTEISFVGVESRRKAVHIPSGIGTSPTPSHRGEANKDGCFFPFRGQERGGAEIGPVPVGCEDPVGTDTACVDGALGNL